MGKWITVLKEIPPVGLLVLARGDKYKGVTLACYDAKGIWHVQPYQGDYYTCEKFIIAEWAYIP